MPSENHNPNIAITPNALEQAVAAVQGRGIASAGDAPPIGEAVAPPNHNQRQEQGPSHGGVSNPEVDEKIANAVRRRGGGGFSK